MAWGCADVAAGVACVLESGAVERPSCSSVIRPGSDPAGIVPFVSVTGRPTEEAVRATVERVAASGAGALMPYARAGLEIDYLGEEWLRAMAWFCREAARLGLKVWLYDEFYCPSGTCRGRVPAENDAWRYAEGGVFPRPGGGWDWETALGPRGWVNICEPDATARFLALTHEVYAERLAPWLADGTVVGVFTDEPGHHVRVDFPRGEPAARFRVWSGLEEEYAAATGRAFRADVERWLDAGRPADGPAADVWPAYSRLHGARFRRSYLDPIRRWCDARGLLFAGHLYSEHDPADSVRCNGDPLLALRAFSVPGIDEIWTHPDPARAEWNTLALLRGAVCDSAAGGIAELFACGPCDTPPSTLRDMVRLAARHGATRFLVCMEAMDQRGLVEKHGYLAPTGSLHPWWDKHGALFAAEARRLAAEAREAGPVPGTSVPGLVAVRFPFRAAALAARAGGPNPPLADLLRALDSAGLAPLLVGEDEPTDLPLVFSLSADGTVAASAAVPTDIVESLKVAGLKVADLKVCSARSENAPQQDTPRTPRTPRAISSAWTLALSAPNLLRVTFGPDRTGVLSVAAPLRARFALRDYAPGFAVGLESGRHVDAFADLGANERQVRREAEPYVFELDGRPLLPAAPCISLRAGFAPLYRETAPIDLAPGVHRLRIASGAPDDNYFLPALLLAGDFAVLGGRLFPRLPTPVPAASLADLGLASFVGTATWTARVRVPDKESLRSLRSLRENQTEQPTLRVDTGNSPAEAFWNGVSLGVRPWPPFEWSLPASAAGTEGELTFAVSTSIAPMFGDPAAPGSAWDQPFWTPPRDPATNPGLLSAEWA